uniref:Uncharacterized protein n=1 Tax=Setaria viridis TaxID=4556 RepID=A0A4U6TP94_SETVI|nr:hypothetical protein SEVIR_8G035600v2 [Setaria viridis]
MVVREWRARAAAPGEGLRRRPPGRARRQPPRRRNAAVAPGESLRRCPRGGLPAREREDGPRRRPAQRRPPRRPPGRTAATPGEGPTAARKGSQGSWCRPAPGARSLALSRVVVILAFV